jgi:hypothetical protein
MTNERRPMIVTDDHRAVLACRLDPVEQADLLAAYSGLAERHLIGLDRRPLGLTATVARTPESEASVERIVRIEHACCPFMDLAVDRRGDGLVLTYGGGEIVAPVLDTIEDHLRRGTRAGWSPAWRAAGMTQRLAVIGVPSGAGACGVGQEQTPAAMRAAGLIEQLGEAGVEVTDLGDSPVVPWRPDRANPRAQNASAIGDMVRSTTTRVADALSELDRTVLVLGGDCTVGIGTMAGVQQVLGDVALAYFDLHSDLNTPESSSDGALDWMALGHMLAIEGSVPSVVSAAGGGAIIGQDRVVLFGHERSQSTRFELPRSTSSTSRWWRSAKSGPIRGQPRNGRSTCSPIGPTTMPFISTSTWSTSPMPRCPSTPPATSASSSTTCSPPWRSSSRARASSRSHWPS